MMKIVLLFIGILVLNSCFLSRKKSDVNTNKNILVEQIQDSTISRSLISENKIDTSILSLKYQFYLKEDSVWKDSVNQIIANFIYVSCNFEIQEKKRFTLNDDFCTVSLDNFKNLALEDISTSEYPLLWSFDANSTLLKYYDDFVTVSNSIYTYTGGAHGNFYQEYSTIDKKTGKILHLNDFINDANVFAFLAEKHFRLAAEINERDDFNDLGFWFPDNKFYCTDNFYFDEQGINFFFNSYEIAPYSHGQFNFSIPFSQCKQFLKIDLSKK